MYQITLLGAKNTTGITQIRVLVLLTYIPVGKRVNKYIINK